MKRPARYYRCTHCKKRQKSRAEKRIKCHWCGRTYKRRGNEAPAPTENDPYFMTFNKDVDREGEE